MPQCRLIKTPLYYATALFCGVMEVMMGCARSLSFVQLSQLLRRVRCDGSMRYRVVQVPQPVPWNRSTNNPVALVSSGLRNYYTRLRWSLFTAHELNWTDLNWPATSRPSYTKRQDVITWLAVESWCSVSSEFTYSNATVQFSSVQLIAYDCEQAFTALKSSGTACSDCFKLPTMTTTVSQPGP